MIVADTNLVAALLLPSEQTRVAEAVFRRDADWAAPLLWRSELRNVLAGEIRRGRLDHGGALALMREAEEHMTGAEYAVESAAVLRLVATSRCSAYDCEFAALADDLGVPLVTSDPVFASEAFAATLAATGVRGFLLEYVGRVGLAKSYGEARVYRLDRS